MSSTLVKNFVDGAVAEPEAWSTVLDPATGEPLLRAAKSAEADVDGAVAAAARAFAGWRSAPPAERSLALLRIAAALEEMSEEFAALESANTGKPLQSTLNEEILPAVDQLRFFAGAARMLDGRSAAEYLAGHTSMVRREPVGVCAQIAPWNYPLLMAVWKIAPALAAGNTVVFKPAESTPVTAVRLAEVASAHLPPGVFNVVCGDRDTGRLLAGHPGVDMVALTGSVRAGQEVASVAGGLLKRLHLELGGNAPAIVFADADVEEAATEIAAAAFFNAGQDCVAASRVLVSQEIYEELVEALVARAKAVKVGPPSDPFADYGPLNNADQLARVSGLIDRLPEHAEIRSGGHRIGERGYFYAPTIVTGVRQADEIVQEEIFGPVVTIQAFTTREEGIALANGVSQGLSCSVWTQNHALAMGSTRLLDFGCVWINTHLRFAAEMPHGGFKDSGFGKDLSAYSMDDYTRVKHVMTAL